MTTTPIHIDTRERALYQHLIDLGAEVTSVCLDVGDCALFTDDEDHRLHTLIERKTLADIAASLSDGRWSEQKHRALASLGDDQTLMYIVETQDTRVWSQSPKVAFRGGVTMEAITSAIVNLWIRYRIPCVILRDVDDTARYVVKYQRQYEKLRTSSSSDAHITTDDRYHCALVKSLMSGKLSTTRKGNVTAKTFCIHSLSGVPGISSTLATCIALLFDNSLPGMMAYLQTHTVDDVKARFRERFPDKRLPSTTAITAMHTLFQLPDVSTTV